MTTLYKKVGRRYRPVAEHEEWDSYPAGAHLVVCSPGSTMRRFNIDPDHAGLLAAANPAVINELLDRLEESESDCLEQARLNGMGASREATLMAKLEAAEKDTALKERVIDSLGSALNAAANERDALRTELADLRSSMTFRTSLIGRIEAEREDLHALIAAVKKQVNAEFRLRMKKEIECNALRAEVEAMKRPTPSVSDSWPIHADPFTYVIQHLNSNPYPLTKDETITFIKELRALYNAATEAKP